jgi:hypothetical protein
LTSPSRRKRIEGAAESMSWMAQRLDAEHDGLSSIEARADQVLDDLLLAIAGADDPYLGTLLHGDQAGLSPVRSTSAKTSAAAWNAELAAGTPQ